MLGKHTAVVALVFVLLPVLALANPDDGVTITIGGHEYSVSFGQIVLRLFVGLLVGSVLSILLWIVGVKMDRVRSILLVVGATGAMLGGFVAQQLDLEFGLERLRVEYGDMVSAILGSCAFLVVLLLAKRSRRKARESTETRDQSAD